MEARRIAGQAAQCRIAQWVCNSDAHKPPLDLATSRRLHLILDNSQISKGIYIIIYAWEHKNILAPEFEIIACAHALAEVAKPMATEFSPMELGQ